MPIAEITAVVLAGGRARRMEGQDKGLIELAGRPLVEHVIVRLRPQVDRLLISANRHLARYEAFGYPVISDTWPDFPGPLAGLLAAFDHSDAEWILTVPCDVPLLPDDLVARLRAALGDSGAIASVRTGDHLQPTFLLAPRTAKASLRHYLASGRRAVHGFLEEQQAQLVDFSEAADAFGNLNTPAELEAFERWLTAQ